MFPSVRGMRAVICIGMALLSGCASIPLQDAPRCYWPAPLAQECRELIEFNSWR